MLGPLGLQPARLLCPRNFPGKSTGVASHSLRHRILPTQGSNLGLLHCRQTLYHLSQRGSPYFTFTKAHPLEAHFFISAVSQGKFCIAVRQTSIQIIDSILFCSKKKKMLIHKGQSLKVYTQILK